MDTHIGRGFVMTLLFAAACGTGSSNGAAAGGGGTGDTTSGAAGSYGSGTTGAAGAGGAWGGGTTGATGGGGASWGGAGTGGGVLGGGVGGAAWLALPAIPPALAAPAGAVVKAHGHAVGAQIYTCNAAGGGADGGAVTYTWSLKAPDARLYDSDGAQIGTHGAGPSWTSNDGSVANGVKVAQVDAPQAGAITWLLLRVASTTGTGEFSDATFVQRLNTVGGVAPATGCDSTTTGTDTAIGYSADYYFYTGGTGAAWLAPPANLPEGLALPGSVVLKLRDHAIGAQVYACVGSGGTGSATTYAWTPGAPDATLYDASFAPVGTYGMAASGPSWTSNDGSVLVAKEIMTAPAPQPDALPWVMLKEFAASGSGVFTDVAIVLRLNTAGGQPPASGCDATTAQTQARVPFSADYYFYKDFGSGS